MLCDKLSNSEVAMLVFLSKYVCYEDCVLRMNGERNAHAMSMKELAQLHHLTNTHRQACGFPRQKYMTNLEVYV